MYEQFLLPEGNLALPIMMDVRMWALPGLISYILYFNERMESAMHLFYLCKSAI